MTYAEAAASNLPKKQVHSIAERLAKEVGYKPGADLTEVISKLGGRVEVADTLLTDPARAGSLYVEAPADFRIVLPAHTPPSRDRFTLAHELGHYILHYLWDAQKTGNRMVALRRGSDRLEWEANWFAAAFLMPEEDFKREYHASGGDLSRVAEVFGVSPPAAEIRARGLGLGA